MRIDVHVDGDFARLLRSPDEYGTQRRDRGIELRLPGETASVAAKLSAV